MFPGVYHWAANMARLDVDWTAHPAPLEVVSTLRRSGHQAWLAGGCVRDLLLGREPADYDVATSASCKDVRDAFRRTVPVKPELGVTMVLCGQEKIEVTTFRTEGEYLDGRRPSSVGPATAEQDVQRRDFTINGLLLDPESGEVLDHVGGGADLRAGLLRCIGNPDERFGEDHLRILRAVRFAVRFELAVDPPTWASMVRLSDRVGALSGERIHEELSKMFAQGPFLRCLELLVDCGAMAAISPFLARALQSPSARGRLARWCQAPLPPLPGLWTALLGLPLCPWFSDFAPGPKGEVLESQDGFLERVRASRQEADAARLVWTRWPTLHERDPVPSRVADVLRDRNWGVLRAILEAQIRSGIEPWPPLHELDAIAERIPKSPPGLGEAFQKAGIPRGPLLGTAIREADRKILDEGRLPDQDLVREVADSIMGVP